MTPVPTASNPRCPEATRLRCPWCRTGCHLVVSGRMSESQESSNWKISFDATGLAQGYYYSVCIDTWRTSSQASMRLNTLSLSVPIILTYSYLPKQLFVFSEDMDGMALGDFQLAVPRWFEELRFRDRSIFRRFRSTTLGCSLKVAGEPF